MADYLKLKKSNCKNCYKCIRNCPVKSIRFSGGQAYIIGNECILCGECFVSCPQNAKQIASSIENVTYLLSSHTPVIASVAPSFIANFDGVGINSLRTALQQLGFHAVEETAIGATVVKNEYRRMLVEENRNILITSSCHSVNLLIQKHYPHLLHHLADTLSPMQVHAKLLKEQYGDCKVVFIGPCAAKKDEANYYDGFVDDVLTFEEIEKMLKTNNISIDQNSDSSDYSRARFFPITGGILESITDKPSNYTYLAVDGVENCMQILSDLANGSIDNCMIEMSACVGSCIGGPGIERGGKTPLRDKIAVSKYSGEYDFKVSTPLHNELKKNFTPIEIRNRPPSEFEINSLLAELGKHTKEQELDCGSCGYNSCREKAIAVIHGNADLTMCLPFLMEKSESMSDNVINNSPNAILVLNEMLEVQKINTSALRLLNIRSQSSVLGEQVVRILDPIDFLTVKTTKKSIQNKRTYLSEYSRYVDETITYDNQFNIFVCIMRDVTDEEMQRQQKELIAKKTVETTDKVIEKQMRVVQEIASLLGETTAETKIALTKLKESISDD